MPFTIQSTGQNIALELAGSVTARDVGELAAQLGSCLTTSASVIVNAARLEDIDTSVLQLLVSLRRTVSALSFEAPSEAFADAVDRCSLRRELLTGAKEIA